MKTNVSLYMILDLWMAYGFDSTEFDAYIVEHGPCHTWAALLDIARGLRTPCAQQLDNGEDWCVFAEGHGGPCYGKDDVGTPNDLLVKYYTLRGEAV